MAPATLKMEDGMFNNLIESSSHARELKRRGSFVLFTTATYVVLFIVAGVVSIYAFDARLEEPENQMTVTMLPMEPAAAPPQTTHNTPPRPNTARPNQVIREIAMSSVNDPRSVPLNTSATPNRNLPIPDRGSYVIGPQDSDPVGVPGNGRPGVPGGTNETVSAVHVDVGTPPPAAPPVERRPPAVKSMGVITGLAIVLPKPAYPPIARQAHVGGAVSVQVLVDETGNVISAKAVKGHPLLLAAAQQAALGARFSPTKLSNQPVKVSGTITYNFVLQ
jgi:protein TonB